MTRYESEKELEKRISVLPEEEVSKVLAYYDELFADKAERGIPESEVVREFGNPSDAAEKILSEAGYAGKKDDVFGAEYSGKAEDVFGEEYGDKKAENKTASDTAGKVKNIAKRALENWPTLLKCLILGVITVFFFGSGASAAFGGAAEFVIAFIEISSGFWATAAKIGMSLCSAGVGLLFFAAGFGAGKKFLRILNKLVGPENRRTDK